MPDYQANRHGSAFWATPAHLRPLLTARAARLGFVEGQAIHHPSQGAHVTVGGARSGKGATVNLPILLGAGFSGKPPPTLLFDPAGQNTAVAIAAQGPHLGRPVFVFNPTGLHPAVLPQHACNVLAFLKSASPTLFSDCVLIAQMCIAISGSGDAQFFEQSARRIVRLALYWITLSEGGVSLPRMWEFLRDITASRQLFEAVLTEISKSRHATPDVQADILELKTLRDDGERTYASVIGTLKNELEVLQDQLLKTALAGNDFSLDYLVNPELCPLGPPLIACVIPGDYKHIWRLVSRMFMGIGMLHARRSTRRDIRPYVLIDECASLGKAEFVLTAFSEDAKFYQTHVIFQDISQIERHYGREGARELLASTDVLQVIAASEDNTRNLVSHMAGKFTLDVINPSRYTLQRQEMAAAMRALLLYDVPVMEMAHRVLHAREQSLAPDFVARDLVTPDEVFTLPADEQLIFVRGGYPAIRGHKVPYWMDPRLKGYLADPYHPPGDWVQAIGLTGVRWRRIVTAPVPRAWQHWPQYQRGQFWSWA